MTTAALLDFLDGSETLADISPALDRAIASPHSTILMPAGMLAVATRQPAAPAEGKTFEGSGRLRFAAGSGARLLLGSGSALLGTKIDGDGRANGNNLVSTMPGCTGITIEDAELGNCSGNALVINTGVSQVRVRRTAFADTGNPSMPGWAVATSGAGIYAGSASDIRVEDGCTFARSRGQGAVLLSSCANWLLDGAQFRNTFWRGVSVWGPNTGEMHDLRGWDIGGINDLGSAPSSGVGTNFVFVAGTVRAEDVLVRGCKVWRCGENFYEGIAIFEDCYGRWSGAFGLDTPSIEGYFLAGRGAMARRCTAVDTVGPAFRYYIAAPDEGPLIDGVTAIRSGGPVVRVHADGVAVSNARIRGVIGRGGDTALKGVEIIGTVAGEIRGCDLDRATQQIPATMRADGSNSWETAGEAGEVSIAEVADLPLPLRGSDRLLVTRGADGPFRVASELLQSAVGLPGTVSAFVDRTALYGALAAELQPSITLTSVAPTGMRLPPWSDLVRVSGPRPQWRNTAAVYPISGSDWVQIDVDTASPNISIGYSRAGRPDIVRVWVDGEPAPLWSAPQAGLVAGVLYWLRLALPAAPGGQPRRVRVQLDGATGLNAVVVDEEYSTLPVRAASRRVAVLGDTFTAVNAVAGITTALDALPARLAALTDWDVWSESEAGCGYTMVGVRGGTFALPSKRTRIAAHDPDDVLIVGGILDDPTQAGYAPAVSGVLGMYAPLCDRLHVLGPLPVAALTTFGAHKQAQAGTLQAAAASVGARYIDCTGLADVGGAAGDWISMGAYASGALVRHKGALWRLGEVDTSVTGIYREPGPYSSVWHLLGALPLVGTGRVGAVTGDGNRDAFLAADNLYRSPAGVAFDAMRLAQIVAAAAGRA